MSTTWGLSLTVTPVSRTSVTTAVAGAPVATSRAASAVWPASSRPNASRPVTASTPTRANAPPNTHPKARIEPLLPNAAAAIAPSPTDRNVVPKRNPPPRNIPTIEAMMPIGIIATYHPRPAGHVGCPKSPHDPCWSRWKIATPISTLPRSPTAVPTDLTIRMAGTLSTVDRTRHDVGCVIPGISKRC